MSAVKIKTQRAWAIYDADNTLIDASNPDVLECVPETIPVLVVPLASVKGCKHDDDKVYGMSTAYGSSLEACSNCGAMRWNNKRWKLPRVLRVGR